MVLSNLIPNFNHIMTQFYTHNRSFGNYHNFQTEQDQHKKQLMHNKCPLHINGIEDGTEGGIEGGIEGFNLNWKKWKNSRVIYYVRIIFTILAIYLSWGCSTYSNIYIRIMYVILSGIFSPFYLIWYLIVRIIIGISCY